MATWTESRGARVAVAVVAQAADLRCARSRADGDPETVVAAGVLALEQHLAAISDKTLGPRLAAAPAVPALLRPPTSTVPPGVPSEIQRPPLPFVSAPWKKAV